MKRSFDLAKQFSDDFSVSNQVFTTSHSPAFYSLEGERVQKYLVDKQIKAFSLKDEDEQTAFVTEVIPTKGLDDFDARLGLAQIIADRSRNLIQQLKVQEAVLSELKNKSRPVILVEGKTDASILTAVLEKLGLSANEFEVVSCDRADSKGGGAGRLKATLQQVCSIARTPVFAIFDRDPEGLMAYQQLGGEFKILSEDLKKHQKCQVYATLLPVREWSSPLFKLAGSPVSIEQMFDEDDVGPEFIEYRCDSASGCVPVEEVKDLLNTKGPKFVQRYVGTKLSIKNKTAVAEKLSKLDHSKYASFKPLLDSISKYAIEA